MDVRELKDSAAEYFRKGKFSKAADAYVQLAKAEPKEGQHLIKLGDSYRRDGRKEPAIEAYKKAAEDYAKQGIVIKAIAACKLILEIDPQEKGAQETLANLCAKRYVKRDQIDTGPMIKSKAPPMPRGKITEPIELDETEELDQEIETAGGMPTKPPAPKAKPIAPAPPMPSRPPQTRPAAPPAFPTQTMTPGQDSVDMIDIDVAEPAPPPRRPNAIAPPPPKVEERDSVELDFDMGPSIPAPSPDRRRGQAIDLSAESDELDTVESGEVLEELEEVELVAENTAEHELLETARSAATKPATPMADILSDSLLIEGEADDGEEVELLSITAGEPSARVSTAPAKPPPPQAKAPAADDFELFDPTELAAQVAPAPVHTKAEQREITAAQNRAAAAAETRAADDEAMRMANDASFDISDDARSEPVVEAKPPPPPPAIPTGDVKQTDVPLFSELPPDAFLDLLERLNFKRIEEGEVIVREGDPGKSIYVLASGKAKVVKHHGTANAIELAVLDDGAFFGEMALLNGAPRVASVVATEDSEVLELTEELLRELTVKHPSVAQSLKKFYRQRLLSNVMAISPLFRAFDKADRKMLVEKFKLRELKPDEAIINEGEKPDGLYVVMHGTALVTKRTTDGKRQMPLAVLKEGDVFGEMSLLSRKPASATVTAKRRTLILRLPKSVFDELMFTHPAVLEVVSELTDERTKVNEKILSGAAESPSEALAML